MENTNWIQQQLAYLDPPEGWEPNSAAALSRHHARRQEEWRRRNFGIWWKLAMAGFVVLAMALLPATRGLAQQLWRVLTVGRVEVVQLDLDLLPKDSSLRAQAILPPNKMVKVADPESARLQIGFLPRLPHTTALRAVPKLSVLNPTAFGITLKANDLRQLLQKAGIDEPVPAQWDGAHIVVQIAGTVMAEWQGSDDMLIQSPPLTMAVPQGFDLRNFTTLVLRGLKLPRAKAERLGARMAAAPAWMLPIESDQKIGIKEVTLRSGPATMLYDYDEDHPSRIERLSLIWSTPDRLYIFSTGMDDDYAIAVANSIE